MSAVIDDDFLQAVCANPEDDAPRLVYADFLEESGDPVRVARAEFIRVQCELARLPEDDPKSQTLRDREAALLKQYRRTWNGPAHRRLHAGPLRNQVRARRGLIKGWHYHRGFIAAVTAHCTAVVRHPEELLALGPLEYLHVWAAREQLAQLLNSPLLTRIQELDLSGNGLSDEHDYLLPNTPVLARLGLLDLRGNMFNPAALARLHTAIETGRLPTRTLLETTGAEESITRAAAESILQRFVQARQGQSSTPTPPRRTESTLARWLRAIWPRNG